MRVGRPPRDSFANTALGKAMMARRLAAGMTRATLASKAGLSLNTVMKVERGQTRDPGVLKVAALCRALSVSVDDLVRAAEGHPPLKEICMSHGIVSIGYEGRSIEEFVVECQRAGVHTVADVRLNAISRKAGFSKTRLRDALAGAGIGYRHMRSLGNAKENRQPFWDGRVDEGRRTFLEALKSEEATASMKELADLVKEQVVAVLCFESDDQTCHRRVVIDEVVGLTTVPVLVLPG